MTGSIPYYRVNPKNNRAYWNPNQRMISRGFGCVSLGEAGPEAEQKATEWTAKWHEDRQAEIKALGTRAPGAKPLRAREVQFVYFLGINDRIKIGTSRKPLDRIADIIGFVPGKLNLLVVVAGTRQDEKRLHDRFSMYRTNGEWFVASKPVMLTITRSAAAKHVIHDGSERTEGEAGVGIFRNRESECQTDGEISL